jgi:hypothetical protein
MRRKIRAEFVALIVMSVTLALNSGCANLGLTPAALLPGADPLVVNTERAQQISLASYNAAIHFDADNLVLMKSQLPQVHQAIQTLRNEFPQAFRDSRTALAAYKIARDAVKQPVATDGTPTTQPAAKIAADNMNAKLAVLQDQERKARDALAAGQAAKSAIH